MYGDWMEEVPLNVKENLFTPAEEERIWEIAHPILSTIKNIFK